MSVSFLKKATIYAAAIVGLGAMIGTADAASQVKVGTLECGVAPSIGFIIGSQRGVDCIFRPSARRARLERYSGVVSRVGLDIGFTGRGNLVWAVFAPTAAAYRPGGLSGNYVGLSAQASLVLGLGANALVGGSNRTFALQPISVEAQTGFNIAAGVAGLTLR